MDRTKYPRTFHLPWSEGATDDDKTLNTVAHFEGQEVVITEKLDGENTSIYPDGYLHARSVDGKSHDSQAWVRALAATVGHQLPADWRICGENVYARHSIEYTGLASYLYVFAIYEGGTCLSWDDTVAYCELLGLQTAPVLYRGPWNAAAVKACHTGTSRVGGVQEGYVVRVAGAFDYAAFSGSVAKFVRADHVQTGAKHWRASAVTPNTLTADGA